MTVMAEVGNLNEVPINESRGNSKVGIENLFRMSTILTELME